MVATVVACVVLGVLLAPLATILVGRPPVRDDDREPLSLAPRCASCRARVAWSDAVPLVGYARLRGRCRACHARIPWWEPAVEVALPVALGLVGWRVGWHGALPAHLVFAAVLVPIAFIDLAIHRIPDRLVFPSFWVCAALLFVAGAADGDTDRLVRAGGGALAAAGFLFVLHVVYPAGMGFGDVKLCLLLGLFLGWYSWKHVYYGLMLGFFLGAVLGVALIALKLRSRKDELPFGPFLAVGALATVLAGNTLV